MHDLNRGTRGYLYAIYAVALGILVHVLRNGAIEISVEFITLALLGAVMSPHVVRLGIRLEMSIAHPFILASMLVLGEPETILMSVICIGSLCFLRTPQMEMYRAFFNISSFVVTTFLTSRTYHLLGGVPGDPVNPRMLIAMAVATLVFYLVNTYSVSAAEALSYHKNVFYVWHDTFLWSAPAFFAGGSLAVAMSYFLARFNVLAFVLALPFCILIYYSYKLYLDKLEEKRQHLDDIQRMNAELELKVHERTRELEIVNQKLQQSNVEIKRANSLKSEFLANMSHELRTPLNAIIGFSELLLERTFGSLNEDQRDYVADILSSGRHLFQLINDILDLSKIEAGRMGLKYELFEVGPVIEEAIAMVRIEAGKKRIHLQNNVRDPDIDLSADRIKLKQILYNLLSNAVKFTPAGGSIRIDGGRDGVHLRLSITDTGIGIPEEDRDRIFDAFTQVDGSYSRNYQGTGLGLTLVKKFVEMHGGDLCLESSGGGGSTFGFVIPYRSASQETSLEESPRSAADPSGSAQRTWAEGMDEKGRVILVVEDNPSNLKLVSELLRNEGHYVLDASSGEMALDILREIHPDLVLMDIQLPGMDGLQITRMLKEDPGTAAIPVVALTAHAMRTDQERARDAGCVGFIAKPFDTKGFARRVTEYLVSDPGMLTG
ncbi:MAG: ATP-binding protein [Acidobacteria bacterium]|nr:ATP-binding protein [Acidobacteriota bacterium]